MKRLYHCSAYYDGNGLVSYSTRVVTIERVQDGTKITLYNYRSMTTLLHIRKYITLLESNYNYELAFRIRKLYEVAGKYKYSRYIISETDNRITVL